MASNNSSSSQFGGGSFPTAGSHGSAQGGFGAFGGNASNTNTPTTGTGAVYVSQPTPGSSNTGTAFASPSVLDSSNSSSTFSQNIFSHLSSNTAGSTQTRNSTGNIQKNPKGSSSTILSSDSRTSAPASIISTNQPHTVQQQQTPSAAANVGTGLFQGVSTSLPIGAVQSPTAGTTATNVPAMNEGGQGSADSAPASRVFARPKRKFKSKSSKNTAKKEPVLPKEGEEISDNGSKSGNEEGDSLDSDDDEGSYEKPGITRKIAVKPFLKPPRPKALFETHIFTLHVDSSSITSYITLYPKYTPKKDGDNDDSHEILHNAIYSLIDFGSLEMETLDQILSVVSDVTEERGDDWYNKDIKIWRDRSKWASEAKEGRFGRVRVLFTIFRDRFGPKTKREMFGFERRQYGLEEENEEEIQDQSMSESRESTEREERNNSSPVGFKLNDKKVTLKDVERVPDGDAGSMGGLSDSAYKAR